jgi:predicted RNase H-like HicB family nuclease
VVVVTRYTVTAERAGKWWSLQCVEVPGAISQVTDLDRAADTIREAIAFVAEVPEETIEIAVVTALPEPVTEAPAVSEDSRQSPGQVVG